MGVDDETILARSEEIEAEGAQAVRRIIADVHSTTGKEWEVPSEMKKMFEDVMDLGVDVSIGAEEFFAKLVLCYAKFSREKRLKREYANACQQARRQERRRLQRHLEDI
ncbi:hypothetical protein CMUS01_12264 [Colletotrichum musicola]|uniref:Uncharacterized protein n=1 Tax=Colletotrichum musicola TaxID=2175873 RepID=A0A8H6JNW8_9PEZI|nr:hypothetical protein CMUS01_12264 [Colletotrichum musicola]